jgi:hypothetical protein
MFKCFLITKIDTYWKKDCSYRYKMPRVKTNTPEQLYAKHRAYVAAYAKKNPDKQRQWSLDYYHRNKDKINEKRRLKRLEAKAV